MSRHQDIKIYKLKTQDYNELDIRYIRVDYILCISIIYYYGSISISQIPLCIESVIIL